MSCAQRTPMGASRELAIASRFWTETGNTLSSLVKSAIENLVDTALLIAPGRGFRAHSEGSARERVRESGALPLSVLTTDTRWCVSPPPRQGRRAEVSALVRTVRRV
jgi:hypothetical protein